MSPRRRVELALLGAALGTGALLGACHAERPNLRHCYFGNGDRTCAGLDPSLPYCAGPGCGEIEPGCTAELPPDACYSPCGHSTLIDDDASCIESGEGDTSTSTDTGGTGTETSATETDGGTDGCQDHDECPELEPYCLLGTCTACDGVPNPVAACFTVTEGQSSICLDGVCVQCTADDLSACTDGTPICDTDANVCVPCTAHDQCPGGAACDLALGECLPADAVWHVDGDGGQDFLTIAEALAALGSVGSGTLIIHEIDAQGYTEGISFSGDRALAVFAAEGERPTLFMTPVSLDISDAARVYARGLILRGEDAALVQDAHLELDAVSLAPSLRRPLRAEDAVLRMRNTMLRTTLDPTYPALDIAGTCDIDIRYATIVALGEHAAVSCQGAALVPGSRIRNSMLVNLGQAAAVQCASPSYEHNGLEDATGFVNNTTIGDATLDWFVNPFFGDLHLSIVSPVSVTTAAQWSSGDPLVDFDGDPRPMDDGSPDFVGADRLP